MNDKVQQFVEREDGNSEGGGGKHGCPPHATINLKSFFCKYSFLISSYTLRGSGRQDHKTPPYSPLHVVHTLRRGEPDPPAS